MSAIINEKKEIVIHKEKAVAETFYYIFKIKAAVNLYITEVFTSVGT